MDYAAAQQIGNDTVLAGVKHFDLGQTLDCGQAFRWAATEEGGFSGIAHGRRLDLEMQGDSLILKNVSLTDFETIWKDYFDLGRSYGHLRQVFQNYDTMTKALAYSPGLRLMGQDPWEMLVSFILSQNSNIPRIKKMVAGLSQHFGAPLPLGGFAFPAAKTLAGLTESDLSVIRSGYRAPYIIDAAKRVACGQLDLQNLSRQPTDTVRGALLQVHGVGPKVADCVLLFGFGRVECFPMDIWMKRVVAKLYPEGFPRSIMAYAGIAQQFLFHYARSNPQAF